MRCKIIFIKGMSITPRNLCAQSAMHAIYVTPYQKCNGKKMSLQDGAFIEDKLDSYQIVTQIYHSRQVPRTLIIVSSISFFAPFWIFKPIVHFQYSLLSQLFSRLKLHFVFAFAVIHECALAKIATYIYKFRFSAWSMAEIFVL